MRLQVLLAWTLCCSLGARVIASAKVIRPSLQTPRTTASVVFRPHHHRQHHQQEQAGRRSGRSNSGASSLAADGVGNIGMRLDGSSSSPVEPIKPLLDLSSVGEGASQAVPPYPMFDEAAPRNVSGLTGNAAYLHCIVHNLGNKSVSWIRQRDLHILTVKRYTYTTDQRFEVIHSEGSKDWILKIKYAQVRDSGNYECQVSTKPVKSYVIHLNIFAAPKAMIIGAPDMHVDKGSTINLTCIIAHSPEPPGHIFWYHNGKVLNYDSPRGGITEVTERGISTTGYLLIQDARPSDTGNYSCESSKTARSTMRVHVLNGETPPPCRPTEEGPCSFRPSVSPCFRCFFHPSSCCSLCWRTASSSDAGGPEHAVSPFQFSRRGGKKKEM
nr:zwei Ig domain protein zig-8-like isoform X2 [Penaeus vannamei]